MENSREFNEQPIPSFFQNSFPGNSAVEVGKDNDFNKKLPSAASPEVEVKVIETGKDG